MTAAELQARNWCGAACAAAQVAATAAGMLPWWALPFTLALTVAVSLPNGPVDQTRARLTRAAGVASVAAFTTIIAMRSISQGREGLVDPTATLRSLTEALVVLSLIMAPNARTPREHRVWLTVTLGVLVAAAAGGATVGQGVLIAAAWIVVLVATSRVQVTDAYSNGAVPGELVETSGGTRQPTVGHFETAIPIVATLVAGAIVFLAVPAGLGGGDLARRLAGSVRHGDFVVVDRDQVGVDTGGFGDLSLLVRGDLPDTALLRVPASSPVLWRATFYRQYTGTSWVNAGEGDVASVMGTSVSVPASADDPPAEGGVVRTDRVEVEPDALATLIWSPGVPERVSGTSAEMSGVLRGTSNVRILGTERPLTSYTVRSVVPPTSHGVLLDAKGPDPTNPAWTALPSDLPPTIAGLAREITAGATSRIDMVRAIEAYLRVNETYSLDTPIPEPGHDAVEDFLFHTHVGFCELFASAEAVMLRTLGVPARLVSGLAYGQPRGSTRLYTARNAHAWVEVYYPGIGWVPSDPTAGAELSGSAGRNRSLFSRAFDAMAEAIPGGRLALAVVGAGLLVAVGWFARRTIRRRGSGRVRRVRPPGPVLAAFLRMIGSRHGPPPRAPAETPRQYLARIGGGRPDVGSAVLTLEQELYGAAPPTDAQVQAAIETFESLVTPSK